MINREFLRRFADKRRVPKKMAFFTRAARVFDRVSPLRGVVKVPRIALRGTYYFPGDLSRPVTKFRVLRQIRYGVMCFLRSVYSRTNTLWPGHLKNYSLRRVLNVSLIRSETLTFHGERKRGRR